MLCGLLAVAVAACGSSSKSSSGSGSTPTIKLTITKDGCSPAMVNAEAGPTNFVVTNDGADSITELELKQGDKIIGESENLTPGLQGKFSVNLKAGEYETSCPGGKSGKLIATAATAETTVGAAAATSTAAVTTYRDYVEQQTDQLVTSTKQFTDAVKVGNVAQAKAEYAQARFHYEAIEPVAESFGDLDPEIDAREGDVPANQWGGFHRIEKQLWVNGNTDGMAPVADKLQNDVMTLQQKVKTIALEPAQIANGAVDLLNEVAKSKITGEEDRYSHTDLSDFEANVDGAKEAAEALEPLINAKSSTTMSQLDAQFADVLTALATYKHGDTYASYSTLTKDDTKALAGKVDALADTLSTVPPMVVSS